VEGERFPGKFRNLEDKIEQLIQTCRNLQQTNSELEAKIFYLEEALKSKGAAEHRHVEEKLVIGEKIEGLIAILDKAMTSK
jgi:hypothetical protein